MILRRSLPALHQVSSFFSRPLVSSLGRIQPPHPCQRQQDQLKSRCHNQRNTVWPWLIFCACLPWFLFCMWAKPTSLLQIMTDSTAFVYPKPRRDETAIDDYHGTKVCHNWHKLNQSLIQMLSRWRTHTSGWRTLTAVRLQSLSPSKMPCLSLTSTLARSVWVERIYLQWNLQEREAIKKELTDLWNYEKYGCPHKEGDKYYFSKNSGLQNQSVVYVQDSLQAEPKVLLDPNTFSADGTVSLTRWTTVVIENYNLIEIVQAILEPRWQHTGLWY